MMRMLTPTLLALSAVVAVSALAFAEETVIEKHTYESQKNTVDVVPVPEVQKKVVEEHTVTTEPPVVKKRTDTTVTTHEKHDVED